MYAWQLSYQEIWMSASNIFHTSQSMMNVPILPSMDANTNVSTPWVAIRANVVSVMNYIQMKNAVKVSKFDININ